MSNPKQARITNSFHGEIRGMHFGRGNMNVTTGSGNREVINMGQSQSVIGSGSSGSWNNINGGSGVMISNNMAVINGVRYNLPPHRSISVNNTEIYLDGRRWKPPATRAPGPLTTCVFELGSSSSETEAQFTQVTACPATFKVNGPMKVRILVGTEFRAVLKVKACASAEEIKDSVSISPENIDVCGVDFEKCTLELHIAEGMERLECNVVSTKMCDVHFPDLVLNVSGETILNDVTLSSLHAVERLDATRVECPQVDASSQSGNLNFTACTVTQKFIAKTMSGSVYVTGTIDTSAMISTMSGSVHLNNFSGKGCSVNTMSGSVHLVQGGDLDHFSANTMSGSLHGHGHVQPSFSTMSGRNNFKHTS